MRPVPAEAIAASSARVFRIGLILPTLFLFQSVAVLAQPQTMVIDQGRSPTIAPDSSFVAYRCSYSSNPVREICLYEVATGVKSEVAFDSSVISVIEMDEIKLSNGAEKIAFEAEDVYSGKPQIFVYDRTTDSLRRVSLPDSIETWDVDSAFAPAITPDGRYIVFNSTARYIAPVPNFDDMFLFRYDLETDTAEIVSSVVDWEGQPLALEARVELGADISDSGQRVLYQTGAELVPNDDNEEDDAFVRNLPGGPIAMASSDPEGKECEWPRLTGLQRLSGDGQTVAFVGFGVNLSFTGGLPCLDPRKTETNSWQLFVKDLTSGQSFWVSSTPSGEEPFELDANGDPIDDRFPARVVGDDVYVSRDGRFIAYQHRGDNIVLGDANLGDDIFVYDRLTGSNSIQTIIENGNQLDDRSPSDQFGMSDDGRFLTFSAFDPAAGETRVYLRDRGDLFPPVVSAVLTDPESPEFGQTVQVFALASDVDTGDQSISSAELQVNGGDWLPMTASDGAFDTSEETVEIALNDLESGESELCVRATDALGWTSEATCESVYVTTVGPSGFNRRALNVVDVNPDPAVFEADLSIVQEIVEIAGHPVWALFYRDENNPDAYLQPINGIPVPQITVDQGEEVIIRFNNLLPTDCFGESCNSSIHWHGVEVDNDSDGTGVTQNRLKPGESYTYRYFAPRPGLFWFHPHMRPGPQTFAGAYGAFIVRDPNEADFQAEGLIPAEQQTYTVVLSDIEFDPEPALGADAGQVGFRFEDDFGPLVIPWKFARDVCSGEVPISETPFRDSNSACRLVQDGEWPLVNGQNPQPEELFPLIAARSGEGIRLRLINTSTNRYYRLAVRNNGEDNNLYRIGGEGGFLEAVRLEGGVLGSWDTKYEVGEVLVSASGRADVVVVPRGEPGDVITISDVDFLRGGPGNPEGNANNRKPGGDLLHILITGVSEQPFSLADGQPLLGAEAIEDLKVYEVSELDELSNPPPKADGTGEEAGTTDPSIILTPVDRDRVTPGKLSINGVQGEFETSGEDYRQVPFQEQTRYARIDDLLELTVGNNTGQHHPFHLHGFSFQPVRVIRNADPFQELPEEVIYEFDYEEFVDVVDIPRGHSVAFRVRLEDRPIITDTRQEADAPPPDQFFPLGGAQGRWVYHCHLFLHASLGMISELVVLTDVQAQCKDIIVNTDPGACFATGVSIDDGSFESGGGPVTLSQNPDNPFGLGTVPVQLTATSTAGGMDSCSANVTVIDVEPPTLTAPPAVLAECNGPGGASGVDLGTLVSADNCPGADERSDAPAVFPLGETTVTWTTTDLAGLSTSDTQKVTIQDTIAPGIDCGAPATAPINATPASYTAVASDVCDAGASATITDFDCYAWVERGPIGSFRVDRTDGCMVSLNGDTIQIDDFGGRDGIVEWTVEATDASGNTASRTCSVVAVRP